jgi:hypothetical protein
MKKVIFHGLLKAFKKNEYSVKANSWKEICESLQANVPNYLGIRKKIMKDLDFVYFVIDGDLVNQIEDLDAKIKKGSKIEIIPVAGQALELIAAALIKLIIYFVVAFAISYLITKLLTPKDPKQIRTSSYIIDGKTNIAARNTAVPLGYGRLRIAPPIVSVFSINIDLDAIA